MILGADSPALKEKRAVALQTISGTGAVHLGAAFLAKFYTPSNSESKTVYVSNPTWANHNQIFSNVKLPIKNYPYFSAETKGLDFKGLIQTIEKAPEGSVVLLHACAHNPTGVDPTQDQWKEIASLMKSKSQFPFFDCAYQGFASGDLNKDAWAIRYFVEQGFEMFVAQSYAKNFGLYGERAGCFHFIAGPGSDAADTATRVGSQLAILQRSEISNPPAYGARIASVILNDEKLFAEWEENLREMSGRIISMRKALKGKLDELKTPGTWDHITNQIGMFSFTGLTEKQVLKIRSDAHVYMTKNGRISEYHDDDVLMKDADCLQAWLVLTPTTSSTLPRLSTRSFARLHKCSSRDSFPVRSTGKAWVRSKCINWVDGRISLCRTIPSGRESRYRVVATLVVNCSHTMSVSSLGKMSCSCQVCSRSS